MTAARKTKRKYNKEERMAFLRNLLADNPMTLAEVHAEMVNAKLCEDTRSARETIRTNLKELVAEGLIPEGSLVAYLVQMGTMKVTPDRRDFLESIIAIIDDATSDGPNARTNVRFAFYRAVSMGLCDKSASSATRVQQACLDLRRAGLVGYDKIADEGRFAHWAGTWDDITEALANWCLTFRTNPWRNSPVIPIVIVESNSAYSVIKSVTKKWRVGICPLKGQGSVSFFFDIAQTIKSEHPNAEIQILFVGDNDVSGNMIEVVARLRLEEFLGRKVKWERIGATDDDVRRLGPTMGTDPKKRDGVPVTSWVGYDGKTHHLAGKALEVEALGDKVLRKRLTDRLASFLDTGVNAGLLAAAELQDRLDRAWLAGLTRDRPSNLQHVVNAAFARAAAGRPLSSSYTQAQFSTLFLTSELLGYSQNDEGLTSEQQALYQVVDKHLEAVMTALDDSGLYRFDTAPDPEVVVPDEEVEEDVEDYGDVEDEPAGPEPFDYDSVDVNSLDSLLAARAAYWESAAYAATDPEYTGGNWPNWWAAYEVSRAVDGSHRDDLRSWMQAVFEGHDEAQAELQVEMDRELVDIASHWSGGPAGPDEEPELDLSTPEGWLAAREAWGTDNWRAAREVAGQILGVDVWGNLSPQVKAAHEALRGQLELFYDGQDAMAGLLVATRALTDPEQAADDCWEYEEGEGRQGA